MIEGKELDTISFVWMQGERDAKEGHSTVYAASMKGLIDQLRTDMKRDDITVVIGRLSDCLKNHERQLQPPFPLTLHEAGIIAACRISHAAVHVL